MRTTSLSLLVAVLGGRIRFRRVGESISDRVEVDDLLAALDGLPAAEVDQRGR